MEHTLEKITPAEERIAELRRDLHRHPELSHQEARTSGIVETELKALGMEVFRCGHCVLGVLEGAQKGKTLLLRADMDALPVEESPENLKKPRCVVSENAGAAHMCGHDFHTAALLGTAGRLAALRGSLKGRVLFAFESGEEVGTGFEPLLEKAAELGPVDAAVGFHVRAEFPVGSVGVCDGGATSGVRTFRVEVTGRGCHGAMPHMGVDPINCLAQILCASSSIISRRVDSSERAVLTACSFHGGDAWNLIPDSAFMEGSLRFFKTTVGDEMKRLLDQMAEGIAAANGCTAQVKWRNNCPPSMNDPELCAMAREEIETLGLQLITGHPWAGSDTMAHYARLAPELYLFVGGANEAEGCGAPHHNARFEVDERALPVIMDMAVRMARRILA